MATGNFITPEEYAKSKEIPMSYKGGTFIGSSPAGIPTYRTKNGKLIEDLDFFKRKDEYTPSQTQRTTTPNTPVPVPRDVRPPLQTNNELPRPIGSIIGGANTNLGPGYTPPGTSSNIVQPGSTTGNVYDTTINTLDINELLKKANVSNQSLKNLVNSQYQRSIRDAENTATANQLGILADVANQSGLAVGQATRGGGSEAQKAAGVAVANAEAQRKVADFMQQRLSNLSASDQTLFNQLSALDQTTFNQAFSLLTNKQQQDYYAYLRSQGSGGGGNTDHLKTMISELQNVQKLGGGNSFSNLFSSIFGPKTTNKK